MNSVTTQHYDNARTGWYPNETKLSIDNVAHLKNLFEILVDGQIYAQPLYLQQVSFPSKGIHNAVFLATENDTVYAWDADTQQPFLWKRSLLAANEQPVSFNDIGGCNNISPKIGITSTPVIDERTNILYVVSKSKRTVQGKTTFHQYLHALNISTGNDHPNSPIEIVAKVPGSGGTGEVGGRDDQGNVVFLPQWALNRPGLLLLNGVVYLGFGAHCDLHLNDYHGWIISYDAATLKQLHVFCTSPDSSAGGVWQGGIGPESDGRYIYFTAGNALFTGSTNNFGNLLDGQHPIWIGDFTGVGHAQVLFYYKGDGHWWLRDMQDGTLNWSLVSQSAGFGNLLDGQHPIWIGDFSGVGHAQVLFYYKGDGHWWLGDMQGGTLNWSLVSQSAGFGNLLDGQHPIWIGDFTASSISGPPRAQVLFYYKGDGHWWLGDMQGGTLNWSLVSQSAGFGNLLDGQHSIWIGDFSGVSHAQVLFYYKGDGHWWLGDMQGGALNWSLVSQSAGFGNLLDGQHPIWIGDFTASSISGPPRAQVLFYYKGDGHWWLGDMQGGALNWSLVSQSAGFGNLLDGQHSIWIGDFTGVGHARAQVLFYYNGDGHWWLGDMQEGTLNWSLVGITGPRSYGNTVLKLTPDLQYVSSFTPADQQLLNDNDWDLGSGGALVIPDMKTVSPTSLLTACGKDGDIFLLNRNKLGGYSGPGGNNQNALYTLPLQPGVQKDKQPGVWGGPAYYHGTRGEFLYYCGNGGKLSAFSLSRINGTLTLTTSSIDTFANEGGTTPVVSSNQQLAGTGVVWAVVRRDKGGRLHLRAYDVNNLGNKLLDLDCGAWANADGGAFIEPTVVNGKVYVGSDDRVTVFGI
jgi:hypothetical protein